MLKLPPVKVTLFTSDTTNGYTGKCDNSHKYTLILLYLPITVFLRPVHAKTDIQMVITELVLCTCIGESHP